MLSIHHFNLIYISTIYQHFLIENMHNEHASMLQQISQQTLPVNTNPPKRGCGRPKKIDSPIVPKTPVQNNNTQNTNTSTIHPQRTSLSSVSNQRSTVQFSTLSPIHLQTNPFSQVTSGNFINYKMFKLYVFIFTLYCFYYF